MGITAGFCQETPSSVQRFRISGGQFGNRCRDCPGLALLRAAILDFRGQTWQSLQDFPQKRPRGCSDSGFQVKTCESMQRRKVPPTVVVAATRSASDTNFLCDNREWFRLQRSMRQQGPRPILIFFTATENGSSCRTPLPHGCSDS